MHHVTFGDGGDPAGLRCTIAGSGAEPWLVVCRQGWCLHDARGAVSGPGVAAQGRRTGGALADAVVEVVAPGALRGAHRRPAYCAPYRARFQHRHQRRYFLCDCGSRVAAAVCRATVVRLPVSGVCGVEATRCGSDEVQVSLGLTVAARCLAPLSIVTSRVSGRVRRGRTACVVPYADYCLYCARTLAHDALVRLHAHRRPQIFQCRQ